MGNRPTWVVPTVRAKGPMADERTTSTRDLVAWVDCGADVPVTRIVGMDAIRRDLKAGHPLWIDIQDPTLSDFEQISDLFDFHPLAIEDVQHAVQRPKADDYEHFLFVVAFGAEPSEGLGYKLQEVDVFLGMGFIVTFHDHRIEALEDIKSRGQRGRIAFERGADMMLHAILDGLIDSWAPIVDQFDRRMDSIETALLARSDRRTLAGIFSLRRSLLDLHRTLVPHRDLLAHLVAREYPWIGAPVRAYLRDIHDHLARNVDTVDRLRDLLDASVETQLGISAQNTNQVMRVLAVLATLGLPLTVVTSFYGMNFDNLPWLHHPAGAAYVGGGLLALEIMLLLLFKRMRWL